MEYPTLRLERCLLFGSYFLCCLWAGVKCSFV